MRRVFVFFVDLYRRLLSPLLPPLCRFEPTCSAYAREAILRHGALKGSLLAAWRVLRCNPLTPGGQYDPVPAPGRWREAHHEGTKHTEADSETDSSPL